jgi:hypothetical protein
MMLVQWRTMLRRHAFIARRKVASRHAERQLQRKSELWSELQQYVSASRSTGCSFADYWHLYKAIRTYRPAEVLECGTGVSTLVIARALVDNEREGIKGRVTSMEENAQWLEVAERLLPDAYRAYVDFRLSPTIEDHYSIFRGVRYKDVPERAYDFVFVDGPNYRSPIDDTPTFDLDFLHVLSKSKNSVAGLVDKRVSSCFVFQQILGTGKVRYCPVLGLGFIAPCIRADLGELRRSLSSANFEQSFRVIATTHLALSKPVN